MKTLVQLQDLLEKPGVSDICFNGHDQIFVDEGVGLRPHSLPDEVIWNEEIYRKWILELISQAGKTWDAKSPFIDFPIHPNHRAHAIFPPISQKKILLSIRSHQRKNRLSYWKEDPHYSFLESLTKKKESILISGATGSGKTTLLNQLLSQISQNERIVALEDVTELFPDHPHFLSLNSRPPNPDGFGEVQLRDLMRQTLRMRPDRIVLGECRGAEVAELLQALNTGHEGALATIHANSCRDAIRRIELLCYLYAPQIPNRSVL